MNLLIWLPTRTELKTFWVDVRARLAGYCNRTIPPEWGGYSHWRCALKRGHDLPHRFINYTWAGPGAQVEYDPIDNAPGTMVATLGSRYFRRLRYMMDPEQRAKRRVR